MNETAEQLSDQRTGVPPVDRVLDSMSRLADLPVGEHVAVFERAHEGLRSALDGAGEPVPAALRPQR